MSASKPSFLDHLGSVLKKILGFGVEAATVAEPIIAIAFPQTLPLYQSTLALATGAEGLSTTGGTGAQKLAQVVSQLLPQAQTWAKQNNIDWPEAEIQKWASAVVDTLNLIPAPASVTGAPPAAQ